MRVSEKPPLRLKISSQRGPGTSCLVMCGQKSADDDVSEKVTAADVDGEGKDGGRGSRGRGPRRHYFHAIRIGTNFAFDKGN